MPTDNEDQVELDDLTPTIIEVSPEVFDELLEVVDHPPEASPRLAVIMGRPGLIAAAHRLKFDHDYKYEHKSV